MGASASNIAVAQKSIADAPESTGHWVSDIKTGYRWATDPITSDDTIVAKPQPFSWPGLPGEIWGPYEKKYTKSFIGGKVFTPPESVDGVPILCRCREIQQYIRSPDGGRIINGVIALGLGEAPPACWEDNQTLANPYGGSTFWVNTRHPAFYEYMMNPGGRLGIVASALLNGGATRKRKRTGRSTRRDKLRKTV